jgi:AraC-like DNA-binding protein
MLYCKKSNYSAIECRDDEVQKMQSGKIYVSELSTSKHIFNSYHFCRGNSNRRKTRFGIIMKGSGTYIYLNKKLNVIEGDTVFIPENIYCYSEWHGNPEIEVIYVSCFMHYEHFRYEPQIINCNQKGKNDLIEISNLLSLDYIKELEAYSMFYKLLQETLPQMAQANISSDKTLQIAIEYITDNWNNNFSIGDLAKKCCVSESTLYHLFQKELGQTPINFLNSIKINIAIDYLENSNCSIATISRLVCFNSENHFRKVFANITKTTPLKFRKKI